MLTPGEVVYGFSRRVGLEELKDAVASGNLDPILNRIPVAPGQVLYLPAGVVHALGPGVRVYEVQTPSDLTYRLYDYGRPRELHLDKALEVAILEPIPLPPVRPEPVEGGECLLKTPYFHLYRYPLRGVLHLKPQAPLLLTLLEGEAQVEGTSLAPPATFLLEPGEGIQVEGEGFFLGASPTGS